MFSKIFLKHLHNRAGVRYIRILISA